jgi:surface protein
MGFMFNDCQSLEELDLSNFNTQKVKTMELMFGACGELKKLNLSNFNVSKADIHGMFYEVKKLKKECLITKEKKIIEQYKNDLKG